MCPLITWKIFRKPSLGRTVKVYAYGLVSKER